MPIFLVVRFQDIQEGFGKLEQGVDHLSLTTLKLQALADMVAVALNASIQLLTNRTLVRAFLKIDHCPEAGSELERARSQLFRCSEAQFWPMLPNQKSRLTSMQ
jgi:hypothetical protein